MKEDLVRMLHDVDELQQGLAAIPDPRLRENVSSALDQYKQALAKHKQGWERGSVSGQTRQKLQNHIDNAYKPVETSADSLSSGYRRDKGQGWGDFKVFAPKLKTVMNNHAEYVKGLDVEVAQAVATVQEKLYGVKIEFDAEGRPILDPIPDRAQLSKTYGLDLDLGQSVSQDGPEDHSLDLKR
jgi:hypothetical protein